MKYELLALDIDGTLLNEKSEITPRTRVALSSALDQGVTVALVTGRRFAAARVLALELGLNTPLVTHNGALTKNVTTLEVIDYHPLPTDIAQWLIRIGREHDADFILCEDAHGLGRIVVEEKSIQRNAMLKKYLTARDGQGRHGVDLRIVQDLTDHPIGETIQVMFTGRIDHIDGLSAKISAEVGASAQRQWTIYRESDLTILDLLNPICSKAHAVATLANSLNIEPQSIMAIGDNFNDVEMLKFAGLGIIMGNADPALKELGFTQTASNIEDGVALAIERHILNSD